MKGLLGTVGVILLVAGSSFAQVTFDFTGAGARAEGMGKAFYGVSDDVSAATWNPAGLIVHEKPMLGFSYGMFAPRGQFENIEAKYDRSGSFNRVSLLSFLAPVRVRGHQFVGSVSYSQLVDDYASANASYDFRLFQDLPNAQGIIETMNFPAHSTVNAQRHYAPYVLNFAFGTRMYRTVSAGFSVNVYTGSAVSTATGFTSVDSFPDLFSTNRQLVTMDIQGSTIDSASYSGVNFTIGFRHTGENLDAGLVIKTPFSLRYNYDRTMAQVTSFNGLVNTASSNIIYFDNNLEKYGIPLIIGAGVAYKPQENLLLALDAELRQYSGQKIKIRDTIRILPGGNTEETYREVDPQWNNAMVVRAGVEYVKETGNRYFPIVPLRAGIGYVPIPLPVYDANGASHSANELALSLGSGVRWTQIYLDMAYTYSSYTIEGFLSTLYDLRNPYIQEKARNHHFTLTFTGYF